MARVTLESVRNAPTSTDKTRAQVHGEELSNLDHKLWDLFSATAAAHPDREALVSLWQHADSLSPQQEPRLIPAGDSTPPCLRWTYHEFLGRVNCLADSLTSLGCEPNMRLAAVLWNSAEWALLFWVAAKLGMTFIPVDPRVVDDVPLMLASVSPHIVVVQDPAAAAALEASGGFQLRTPQIRVQCSQEEVHGWTRLNELLAPAWGCRDVDPMETTQDGQPNHTNGNDVSPTLIVFTSGTTGNPKGCPHTDRNLIAQASDYDLDIDPMHIDRWLVHTPVCHIFAINNTLRAWKLGEVVIFAAKTFDVSSTLKALLQEKCSIMSATPTLVKALMAQSNFPSPSELWLTLVTIGGTSIGRDDIDLCKQGLGTKDAIQAYGMSEGAPLISWSRQDPMLVDGFHPGVGKALPGVAIRICRPGTQEVLARSETGELHVGGPSVISQYMNGADPGSFYTDANGRWLITGDQAHIDEDGVVHIFGRYKDLIIRGGENISPAKIESTLSEIPGLQVQVIGIPDEIAGQVPVAVVKLPANTTKSHVLEKANTLGQRYRLDAVYTLAELGFDIVPVTSLGKPKKGLLKEAILKLLGTENVVEPEPMDKMQEYSLMLQSIWERLTGKRPSTRDSVGYYADSITMLQYCDRVLSTSGMRLYLQDLAEHDTIEKQAQLLDTRRKQQASGWTPQTDANRSWKPVQAPTDNPNDRFKTKLASSTQPPSFSSPDLTPQASSHQPSTIREAAHATLTQQGLYKCKIEEILPIRTSLHRMVIGQRPHSYHVRMVFRVRGVDLQQICRGLEKCLAARPMFRTILCQPPHGQPHHAIIGACRELFEKQVTVYELATEEEAKNMQQDGSTDAHSSPFMFTALIMRVKDTNQHYISMTYNHSVMDAMTILPFQKDLDRAIKEPNANITSQTPYRLFANLFDQYQDSMPGKESIAFHVQRLRGISKFKQALWPPQQAPGWMIANDESLPHFEERQKSRDRVWEGEWEAQAAEFRFPRRSRIVRLPQLAHLREISGVGPAMFAKCAVVLFNILKTGSSYALFNTFESGRSWPFVPSWMQNLLPPAMSIDGPTFEWILTVSEVIQSETLIQFLQRMSTEQEQLQQHEHVPWDKVVHELREEGPTAVDASFRQSFVWDVSMGIALSKAYRDDFQCMDPLARHDWADCGFFWNAFMLDHESLFLIVSWDTAQMNVDEVEDHCDSLAGVMRKLADEGNWERKICDVFSPSK